MIAIKLYQAQDGTWTVEIYQGDTLIMRGTGAPSALAAVEGLENLAREASPDHEQKEEICHPEWN